MVWGWEVLPRMFSCDILGQVLSFVSFVSV